MVSGDRCSYSSIWRLAYPLIITNASLTIMHFCDRKFLAMHSHLEVAAALPAGVYSFTLTAFWLILVLYTSTIVAQYYGSKQLEKAIRATWNGIYLAVVVGLITLFVMPWIGLYVIHTGGHPTAILELERKYFITLIPCGLFMCVTDAIISFFNGVGRTQYAAVINIICCVVNVVLDYALIFGKWGAPEMGIAGAGIATAVSCVCGTCVATGIFLIQDQRVYPTRQYRTFCMDEIKRIFRFGSPAALQCLSDLGGFAAFAYLVGFVDETAMVVTTIVLAINQFAFYPMMGLTETGAITTGQLMGANQPSHIRILARHIWKMATVYLVFIAIFYLLFPDWLIGQFASQSKDVTVDFETIKDLGRKLLVCALLYNFADAVKFTYMGILRGAGDTKACVVITTLCAWVLMFPGMIVMIFLMHRGIVEIWFFTGATIGVEACLYYYRFRTNKWRNIQVIARSSE